MADRVTERQLRNMLKFINQDIATENKKLAFDIAYGGIQLVLLHKDKGNGESDLSRRGTKREMYEILYTIQRILDVYRFNNWLNLPPKKYYGDKIMRDGQLSVEDKEQLQEELKNSLGLKVSFHPKDLRIHTEKEEEQ